MNSLRLIVVMDYSSHTYYTLLDSHSFMWKYIAEIGYRYQKENYLHNGRKIRPEGKTDI